MGLFQRMRRRGMGGHGEKGSGGKTSKKAERDAAARALEEWVAPRHGVEIFVEPQTAVTGLTMLLVAHDGEFTRRPIGSTAEAEAFARAHTMPIYDANVVGYPQRMRDYSRRQSIQRKRALKEMLGDDE